MAAAQVWDAVIVAGYRRVLKNDWISWRRRGEDTMSILYFQYSSGYKRKKNVIQARSTMYCYLLVTPQAATLMV